MAHVWLQVDTMKSNKMHTKTVLLWIILLVIALLTACGTSSTPTPSQVEAEPSQPPEATNTPEIAAEATEADNPQSTATEAPVEVATLTPTPDYSPTPDTRLDAYHWRNWPLVPEVSENARQIYLRGLEQGHDPNAFSKVGDCQSQPAVFFGIYDTADRYYLGEDYEFMQRTIDHFPGSFGRESMAVRNGLSVASVFSPLWADQEYCNSGETPIDCEFRLHNPSIVIISLGTNWQPGAELSFDEYLRELVQYAIDRNVLPILVTKADNIEGDNLLNEIIAQVAYDYDIPLWNFWAAVQHLPNHGVDPEKKGGLTYLVPEAWDIKSFTGLEALDAVWTAVSAE